MKLSINLLISLDVSLKPCTLTCGSPAQAVEFADLGVAAPTGIADNGPGRQAAQLMTSAFLLDKRGSPGTCHLAFAACTSL